MHSCRVMCGCFKNSRPPDTGTDLLSYERAKGRVLLKLFTTYLGLELSNKRILEIGCATGVLMQLLEQRGAQVWGVDVESPWSGHYCYRPEKRVLVDIQENDVPAEVAGDGFDLVIAQEVIEHIKKPYDFLHRIWGMLRPDGCIFLSTCNLVGITALLKGRRWCGTASQGHFLLYSPRSLNFTVGNCGFEKIKSFTNVVPIVYQDQCNLLRWLNKAAMWTIFGGGLMALYRKKEAPRP